jgi:hemolysin activation/secretion protein
MPACRNKFNLSRGQPQQMRFRIGVIVMLTLAKVFSGQAEETNSPAVIENLFAAPLPAAANAPPRLLPLIDAREYFIEGNTALSVDKFNLLTNYLGELDITRLREGLDKLQALYRNLGFSNVIVTLPEQEFTNGIIRVQIVGQETNAATEADLTAAITNLFAAPKPTFVVRGYLIEGNTALPAEKFNLLTNYIGDLDFAQLREGLGRLQLLYRNLGFATIGVTLPQQRLTNGIVRVKIVEGKLGHVVVTDNRHFSTDNVLRALPSLETNLLLNTRWFQSELDRANLNQDRQIYPVISPGPEPGTSDLTLKVKDRLPLHGRIEVNDKSSPVTPLLRLDTSVQYNNLWQREHQIGFDYNFSPQEMKSGDYSPDFYDQPMVASYSGFYRFPLGRAQGLRETYDRQPVDFGYDEITHSFRQLPATGNPELIVYASRSVSDTPVRYGPLSVIFTNTLAQINSQSAERSLTYDNNLGTRLTVPVRDFLGIHSSLQLGFDYKSYDAPSFGTNLTYFSLYALDQFGNPVLVTNQTIRLPSNSRASLDYLPLSWGWSAFRPDQQGVTSFSLSQNIFLAGLASARTNFQVVAAAPDAGGNYTTLTAGLTRRQNLPDDWSLLLRANGQWASAPLIGNEQFALGGTAGVRGYEEGEVYGDDGWRVMLDVNAPPVNVGYFPDSNGGDGTPAYLRCSWFMDYGETYLIDRPTPLSLSYREWGTGVGCYLTAGEHFDARITLAWALHDTPSTYTGEARAYFSVGFQF